MEENKLKFNLQFFADQPDDPDEPGGDGKKGNPDKKENDEGTEITFTPEQQKKVDEILERRVAHEKKKADEYAKEKAEEAAKLAKMNKDQKAEYELEKIRKENEELRAEKAKNEMRSEARSMFEDKNIKASDDLLDFVVKEDAESTKKNVESFVDLLDGMVKAQVKEALRQDSPKTFKSNGLSKEDILNIKDDSQRQMAIAQNRQLFN
ncbi:TPA: DUF4355 domain-containing protein [Staphylococcus argenteus]|nr:DUF4355 domain-containing protein [Staphylococcus argenteus]HDY9574708.1 DUF4355 domain-containing protein [Staphylococcus argenteus]